jgi:hypothetical protein
MRRIVKVTHMSWNSIAVQLSVGVLIGVAIVIGDFLMYAISSPSDVYHLLTPASAQDRTLCDLSVVPIVIDRAAYTSSLHLTSERPAGRELCIDCAKVERERILD